MSQSKVQEEAAVRVQAMVLRTIREGSAEAAKLIESADIVSDPAKGNFLDKYM